MPKLGISKEYKAHAIFLCYIHQRIRYPYYDTGATLKVSIRVGYTFTGLFLSQKLKTKICDLFCPVHEEEKSSIQKFGKFPNFSTQEKTVSSFKEG